MHERSSVCIHTDPSLMPADRKDWAPAVMWSDPGKGQGGCTLWFSVAGDTRGSAALEGTSGGSNEDSSASSSTSSTNSGDSDACTDGSASSTSSTSSGSGGSGSGSSWDLFQTWNPLRQPSPAHVLRSYSFERPMATVGTLEAVRKLWELQGSGGVWFVGAYSLFMVPLQESACLSALRVAAALGEAPAWLPPSVTTAPLKMEHTPAEVAARALSPVCPQAVAALPCPPASCSAWAALGAAWTRLPGLVAHGFARGLPVNGMALQAQARTKAQAQQQEQGQGLAMSKL